jgi:hypothetical protein
VRELGEVGLILIEPVGNHTGGIDTDKEGLVREAIAPLNRIADDLKTMVVGVRHLGKDASRGALSSVLGSVAWVDVPRCVILMATDDEDDRLFHAQVVAGNRGPRGAGRAYRLELVDVPAQQPDEEAATDITLLVAAGDSAKDVEQLLGAAGRSGASASASAQARELILDLLEDPPGREIESDDLDARVAAATGLSAKTAKNVRSDLARDGLVKSRAEQRPDGTVNRWLVHRTNAPRPEPDETTEPHPESHPHPTQKPHNHATSRPRSLERVDTGPRPPHPDSPSEGPSRDLATDTGQ